MTRRRDGAGNERLEELHAQLVTAVGNLADGEQWRRMLTVAARFHRYSPNNVLLITVQRPDATRVAGYHTWRSVGRQVRGGEKGIAILAPVSYRRQPDPAALADGEREQPGEPAARALRGFRVARVFDISQTDGAELPEVRPTLLGGGSPIGLWADLLDLVEGAGYRLDYGEVAPANGVTDHLTRTVVLRGDLSGAQATKTLAHELAHVLLHDPDSLPAGFTRPRAEVEAESVAYLVCTAHGLNAGGYTVPYVAGWAGGDTELLRDTATRVLATAREILTVASPGDDGTIQPAARTAEPVEQQRRTLGLDDPVAARSWGRAG